MRNHLRRHIAGGVLVDDEGIMMRISVVYDDPFRYCCDLAPDITAAAQREVTPEELSELQRLQAEYDKFQVLLKTIQERPELEWEAITKDIVW